MLLLVVQLCSYMQQQQAQHHILLCEMSAKAVNSGRQVHSHYMRLTRSSCCSGMLDSRSPARDTKLQSDSTTLGISVQKHDTAAVRGVKAIR